MSRLDELINEFCPNGVEYKKLNECTEMKRGTSATKNTLAKGDIPVISGGREPAFYCDISNRDGETVTIAGSGAGAGYVQYWNKPIFVNDAFSIKGKDKLNTRYIYHYLLNIQEEIYSTKKGGGVPHVHVSSIENFKIPLPPLPVQEEIVRILDNFTELITELTAELAARKKQYEYYRDSILENNDYPCKQLGELCKFVRGPFGGALKKECFQKEGFAVYEQQHAIYERFEFRYYVSKDKFNELQRFEVFPNNLIMSCSGTMGKIAIIPSNAPRGIINQALLKLTANDDVDVKYLKYCFESTIAKQMNDNARGGAIKNVASVDILKKIQVKLPPLAEQQRIVDILDRFDTICNDISSGLPAEIKARQQQYEYYRNKLLTFPTAELWGEV